MKRTLATAIVAVALLVLFAWRSQSQPQQGFGPTFDATNLAMRVNVVAGAAGGLSASTFGTAFPSSGVGVGGKDPNGAFASVTISSTGRLQTTCDNCSSSAASFGTAFPTSGGPVGGKDANGAFASVTTTSGRLDVNVPAVVNVRTTSDSTLTGTVTQANASSFNATVTQGAAGVPWNARTTSDSTLTATVTQTTAANLQVRPDYSAATGTSAPGRVAMTGGWGSDGAAKANVFCDQSASISTANTGNWQLVASGSGQNVYLCGYTFVAGTTPVGVKFVGGQTSVGAPCSGNSVDLTGVMTVAASGGAVNAVSAVPILFTAVNHGLCINLSNGAPVGGHITYTRY